MATKKVPGKGDNYLEVFQKDFQKRTVSTRFGIVEYRADSYADRWGEPGVNYREGVNRLVSPEFETEEEAWLWSDDYEPQSGTIFRLAKISYLTPIPQPLERYTYTYIMRKRFS